MEHAVIAAQSPAMQKKMNSAKRHVNYFLSQCGDKFPFKTFEDIKPEDLSDEFLGLLATYFGQTATGFFKNTKRPLAYLTAVGYMSGFKSAFLAKYKHLETIPSFLQQERWHTYLSAIYKLKYKYAMEQGTVSSTL